MQLELTVTIWKNKLVPSRFLISITLLTDKVSGTSKDWVHDYMDVIFSYTLELRDSLDVRTRDGFDVPPEDIIETGEETYIGIFTAIKEIWISD